ncbi:MAG TPA: Mut7-C RNAse domain-containing protein [Planctomycetota bacterium]|jgi:hypothetical protein
MSEPLQFACDAMLGGLARWLRAAGYDAAWYPDIDDWDFIRIARRESRFLLSCDTRMFEIGALRDGEIPSLLLPTGLRKLEQLAFVLERLALPLLTPRCMACGGELVLVAKEHVKERAPPRSFAWVEQFFECARCKRLFWQGTHWRRIASSLQTAGRQDAGGGRQE